MTREDKEIALWFAVWSLFIILVGFFISQLYGHILLLSNTITNATINFTIAGNNYQFVVQNKTSCSINAYELDTGYWLSMNTIMGNVLMIKTNTTTLYLDQPQTASLMQLYSQATGKKLC